MNWTRTSAFVNQIDSEDEFIWRSQNGDVTKLALRQRRQREQCSLPCSKALLVELSRRCTNVGLCNVFGSFTTVYSLVSDQFHIVECTENSWYNWSLKSFRCCWHALYFFISSYFPGCWNRKRETFRSSLLRESGFKIVSFFTSLCTMFNQAWRLILSLTWIAKT